MVAQDFQVDLNKALVFQVGNLGEAYQQWVHQPIVCTGSPRFFENEIFEFLTRTVWWAVPTIWLPVVCYLISMSVRMGHSFPGIVLMVLGMLLGHITYDVTHYYLHHGKPSKRLTQSLKRYHLNHHFRNQSKGFGVTSSLWDNVFGTLSSTKASKKMNNQ